MGNSQQGRGVYIPQVIPNQVDCLNALIFRNSGLTNEKAKIMKKLSSIALAIIATTASAFEFSDNDNGNSNDSGNQPTNTPALQATLISNNAMGSLDCPNITSNAGEDTLCT